VSQIGEEIFLRNSRLILARMILWEEIVTRNFEDDYLQGTRLSYF
jgi:hypothetical protein